MSQADQSTKLLSKELLSFCASDSLVEEDLREIIERHGLTPKDSNVSSYKFFRAACSNKRVNEGIIRYLLEYFPDAAGTATVSGWRPLHLACSNKNMTLGIIKVLIDATPESVRSVTNNGSTPLHMLCYESKVDEAAALQILKLLIEKYPEAVQCADNYGDLPIHLASCWGRSIDFCRVLIEAYRGSERLPGKFDALPLHCACFNNTLEMVEYYYQLYPDAIHAMSVRRGAINYPIHCAISGMIFRDNPAVVEIVQFLLDCDPNQKLIQLNGAPLLQFACGQQYDDSNVQVGIQIIKSIYDAHPEAIEDNTIEANIHHYHQQVQAFINKELVYARQAKDINLMITHDVNLQLPLHRALQNNATLGSVKLLVKGNPAALHSTDDSGALPLHIACQHNDSAEVVKYLIGRETASLAVLDQERNAALHCAGRGAKYETIALLLEKYDAVSVSKRNADEKLPIELLWESDAGEDRESVEYTDSIFRLLQAYPETLRNVGTDLKSSRQIGNGKKSCRNSLLVFIRKTMRSSRKRVQNIMR